MEGLRFEGGLMFGFDKQIVCSSQIEGPARKLRKTVASSKLSNMRLCRQHTKVVRSGWLG